MKFPKYFSLKIVLLAFSLLISGSALHSQTTDVINSYINSLNKIKSYDITYNFDFLNIEHSWDGKNEDNLSALLTQTNREMFAPGLGWRDERYLGDKDTHTISVLDWKTFANNVKTHAVLGRGLDYSTWFNPIMKGIFFKDWLNDRQTVVTLKSDLKTSDGLICLNVINSDLPFSSIQIWFDSQHGYLPSRFEYFQYSKSQGKDVLAQKIEVKRFVQIENGGWMPSQIIRLIELPSGQAGSGQRITLESEHSTLNMALPGDMFLATSLPEVNMKEDGGWECYYPPALLQSTKNAVALGEAILSSPKIKAWKIIVFIVLNIVVISIILIKTLKPRTNKITT